MDMHDTFDKVRTLLVSEFQLDPALVTASTPLTDLGVDSLAALEFAFTLEDVFEITLDAETDLRGGLFQDVVDAVDRALSQKAVTATA
jgi:acyl carrier protein